MRARTRAGRTSRKFVRPTFFAENLTLVHAALVKPELPGVVGTLGSTTRPAFDFKSRSTLINQESGDQFTLTFFGLFYTGQGKQDREIGFYRAADKMFGTIDDKLFTFAHRFGHHRQNIRTSSGFGQCKHFFFLSANTGL